MCYLCCPVFGSEVIVLCCGLVIVRVKCMAGGDLPSKFVFVLMLVSFLLYQLKELHAAESWPTRRGYIHATVCKPLLLGRRQVF